MVLKPIDQLKKRIQELEEENDVLQSSGHNQLFEIEKLGKELEQLKNVETNLKKEKQKRKEHEKTIQQLEVSLLETKTELDKIKYEELKSCKEKLSKASNEVGFLNKTIRQQEKELSSLRHQVKQLKMEVDSTDNELSKHAYEVQLLKIELENTTQMIPSTTQRLEMKKENASFKEFVKVKRELSQLRGENRKLQARLNKDFSEKHLLFLNSHV